MRVRLAALADAERGGLEEGPRSAGARGAVGRGAAVPEADVLVEAVVPVVPGPVA